MLSNVLVTGSEGFVGNHLRRILPFDGLDLCSTAKYNGCISDMASLIKSPESIEYVIHLADLRFQYLNEENLSSEIAKHSRFLQYLRQLPNLKKLIYASSCSVYGQSKQHITEQSPINLTSYYAKCKSAVEDLIQQSHLPHIILRFGTAYGGEHAFRNDLFINAAIRSCIEHRNFDVFGADCWRPYVNVVDFSRALKYFLLDYDGPLQLINVVETNQTKRAILDTLRFNGLDTSYLPIDDNRPDHRDYFVTNENVKFCGYSFTTPFELGIKRTIDKYEISTRNTIIGRTAQSQILQSL